MQRFNTSDLEKLEAYIAARGFTYEAIKRDERKGKPPMLTLELKGSGTQEALNEVLLSSPFVLTGMSTRSLADGALQVRLQLMQSKVLEDDGWKQPVRNDVQGASAEFGEQVECFGTYVDRQAVVPEMGE